MKRWEQGTALVRHNVLAWLQEPGRSIFGAMIFVALLVILGGISAAHESHLSLAATDPLLFSVTGLAILDLFWNLTLTLSRRVERASEAGLFELCGNMFIKPQRLVGLHIVPIVLGVTGRFVLYTALMLLMRPSQVHPSQILVSLIPLSVGAISIVSIGIFSSSLTLLFRRVDPFTCVFVIVTVVMSGAVIPVEWITTKWSGALSMNPITLTLEGVRAAIIYDQPLENLTKPLLGLGLYAAFLLPFSLLSLNLVFMKRQNDNASGHY